jgi:hypothetical protein
MPNARKKGTKLAGAYIEEEKYAALARLAKKRGYPDKAAYIRVLLDEALASEAAPLPKSGSSATKEKRKAAK